MRVLVTGSRDWSDRMAVYRELLLVCEEFDLNFEPDEYGNTLPDPRKITVVHGACPTGADLWAVASWPRNAEMVALGADLCLAFIGPCTRPGCRRGGSVHGSHGAVGAGIEVRRSFGGWGVDDVEGEGGKGLRPFEDPTKPGWSGGRATRTGGRETDEKLRQPGDDGEFPGWADEPPPEPVERVFLVS